MVTDCYHYIGLTQAIELAFKLAFASGVASRETDGRERIYFHVKPNS